ncbi:MAG: hypothetical protein LVQ95_04280 [Candidatus Micrarchaeales archaeon]|nr:hypothetical protein [Candidatus Micrarchaeales archaeon]
MKRYGFNIMMFLYGAMAGVPALLLVIAFTSLVPQLLALREVLAALAGIGAIVYGIISLKEVFLHG